VDVGRLVSIPVHRFGADWVTDFGQMGMCFWSCLVSVSAATGASLAEELVFDVWLPSGLLTLPSIWMCGGMLRVRWVSASVA